MPVLWIVVEIRGGLIETIYRTALGNDPGAVHALVVDHDLIDDLGDGDDQPFVGYTCEIREDGAYDTVNLTAAEIDSIKEEHRL